MGIAIRKDYKIYYINVIIIFSYEFLNKKIYIILSIMFKNSITQVYFFQKALYSLKQAL